MAGAETDRNPPQTAVIVAGVWVGLLCAPWFLFFAILAMSWTPDDRPGMWSATAGFPVAVFVAIICLILAWRLKRAWLALVAALLPTILFGLIGLALRMDV